MIHLFRENLSLALTCLFWLFIATHTMLCYPLFYICFNINNSHTLNKFFKERLNLSYDRYKGLVLSVVLFSIYVGYPLMVSLIYNGTILSFFRILQINT